MFNRIKIAAVLVLILTIMVIWHYFQSSKVIIKDGLKISDTYLDVELAQTAAQKRLGLSGRKALPQNAGMLFVYDEPSIIAVWMPNMNFAIDVIWLDKDFKIVDILPNLSLDTYPQIFSSKLPAQFMLEVNAGFSQKHGLVAGGYFEVSDELKGRLTQTKNLK